jgi:ATP-dependent Lhr-like helicase
MLLSRLGAILREQGIDPEALVGASEAPAYDKYDEFVPAELLRRAYAKDRLAPAEVVRRIAPDILEMP